jgi:hypothetical protein
MIIEGMKARKLEWITGLVLLLTCWPKIGWSEDTLESVMLRMQATTATRVAYQETRSLALLEDLWQGSGFLYVTPTGLMIKQQLQPDIKLMGISNELILYFDPVNDVRYRGGMADDNPMILQTSVFKALLSADMTLLNRLYQVDFIPGVDSWVMRLQAKHDPDSLFRIEITGLAGQPAERVKMLQEDGDSSEITLGEVSAEQSVSTIVADLYRQLTGE